MAGSRQELALGEWTRLADDEARREYFHDHPELLCADTVGRLADESARLQRIDLDRADALAGTAAWLADRLDDPTARGRALRAVGGVLYFQRDYEAAAQLFEQSVEACIAAGAELEAAIACNNAIPCLGNLNRYDKAMELAATARRVFTGIGDDKRLSILENNVAMVLSRQDRFPEAIERYHRALELLRRVGRPVDVAVVLRNIAVCYQDLNDFHASLEAYSRAREYCREHRQTLVGLEVEYNIAYIHFLRGEYSQAIHLFEEARRHSKAQGDAHHAALCDLDLAEIFLELNLVHDAEQLAKRANAAFTSLGMMYETGKALSYEALAAARRGEIEPALELLRRARHTFEAQENRVSAVAPAPAASRMQGGDSRQLLFESDDYTLELSVDHSPGVADSVLRGQILEAQGKPQSYTPVFLVGDGAVIGRTISEQHGTFELAGRLDRACELWIFPDDENRIRLSLKPAH